jgi:hypothetical protein
MGSTEFVPTSQPLLVLHIVLQDKPIQNLTFCSTPCLMQRSLHLFKFFLKKCLWTGKAYTCIHSLLMKFHQSFPTIDVTDFVAHATSDGKKQFPFVMVGGVLENRGEWDLCKPIAEKVTQMFPGAQAIQPKVSFVVLQALL